MKSLDKVFSEYINKIKQSETLIIVEGKKRQGSFRAFWHNKYNRAEQKAII